MISNGHCFILFFPMQIAGSQVTHLSEAVMQKEHQNKVLE